MFSLLIWKKFKFWFLTITSWRWFPILPSLGWMNLSIFTFVKTSKFRPRVFKVKFNRPLCCHRDCEWFDWSVILTALSCQFYYSHQKRIRCAPAAINWQLYLNSNDNWYALIFPTFVIVIPLKKGVRKRIYHITHFWYSTVLIWHIFNMTHF